MTQFKKNENFCTQWRVDWNALMILNRIHLKSLKWRHRSVPKSSRQLENTVENPRHPQHRRHPQRAGPPTSSQVSIYESVDLRVDRSSTRIRSPVAVWQLQPWRWGKIIFALIPLFELTHVHCCEFYRNQIDPIKCLHFHKNVNEPLNSHAVHEIGLTILGIALNRSKLELGKPLFQNIRSNYWCRKNQCAFQFWYLFCLLRSALLTAETTALVLLMVLWYNWPGMVHLNFAELNFIYRLSLSALLEALPWPPWW